MKFAIINSHAPLQREDIAKIEKTLNITFPDDYRNFLLKCNGGNLEEYVCFAIPDHPIPNQASILRGFYSIDSQDYHDLINVDLTNAVNAFLDRMPSNLIPIASDPGGNQICISVDGLDRGKIYFWDHEDEADEGESPTYRNLHLIADSFDDLMNNKLFLMPD